MRLVLDGDGTSKLKLPWMDKPVSFSGGQAKVGRGGVAEDVAKRLAKELDSIHLIDEEEEEE